MSLIKNTLPENMDEIFPDDTDFDFVPIAQSLKKMEEDSEMEEAYFASIH